ncbi:MAG: PHP-associated domain-containing protein [Candidatus Bathyarchaeia archaeon]
MQLKIDLHVHTNYSYDSVIKPEEVIFYAQKRGLDGVAITDHDIIDCALKMVKETRFLIIPGIEISSLNGHVLALNIQEPIQKGLSVNETVDKIHSLGGVAVACHPTSFFKGSLGERVSAKFDAVEVINASAFPFKHSIRQSQKIASHVGSAQVGGSDAHYGPEVGYAYTIVNAESDVEDIVKSISNGLCQPFGKAIPLTTRLKREILVFKRKLS